MLGLILCMSRPKVSDGMEVMNKRHLGPLRGAQWWYDGSTVSCLPVGQLGHDFKCGSLEVSQVLWRFEALGRCRVLWMSKALEYGVILSAVEMHRPLCAHVFATWRRCRAHVDK